MANLSFLTIGIPASGRLVFRNIHDQVIAAAVEGDFGGVGPGKRHRKRKKFGRVIKFSDYDTLEARAAAIAEAALSMGQITDTGAVRREDELEDDEMLLLAAMKTFIH